MSEPLVIAKELRKSYKMGRREVEVLQGVSITVERGEFVALRGASGAGKSTLLHLIGGLDTADAGEITVAGKPFHSMSAAHLARFRTEKIGFIFQA